MFGRCAPFSRSRHPGESRGPASGRGPVESWIPAFAGKTASGGALLSRRLRRREEHAAGEEVVFAALAQRALLLGPGGELVRRQAVLAGDIGRDEGHDAAAVAVVLPAVIEDGIGRHRAQREARAAQVAGERARQRAVGAMGREGREHALHAGGIARVPGDGIPVGGHEQCPAARLQHAEGLAAEGIDVGHVFRHLHADDDVIGGVRLVRASWHRPWRS